jgi:hypothetical protein
MVRSQSKINLSSVCLYQSFYESRFYKEKPMSHIVEAKTSIQHPDLAVLRQAVELVASQRQGTVENFYVDYYGKRHPVVSGLALFMPDLPRGIGLTINQEGSLTFTGDPWAVQRIFEEVQQEVVQMYVSLATMQALQTLGYSTQAQDGLAGQVVIQGVSYA